MRSVYPQGATDLPPSRKDERGSVLLVSLAILALLTVFGLTLTSVCNLERQASANYVLQIEARLAAEAGCAAAISQARSAVDTNWFSSGEWYVSGAKRPGGAWTPTNGYFLKSIGADGSGGLVYYSVQSFDCGSRLSVNLNTPNIIGALGTVGLTNAAAVNAEAQTRGGFRSRKELREFIISTAGQTVWDNVRDRITVHEVHSPVADLTGSNGNLPISYSGGARGSAMVNINGASVEVLTAVLSGLSGTGISFDGGGTLPSGEWLTGGKNGPRSRALTGVSANIGAGTAAALAGQIAGSRPFQTWQAFDDFLKGKVSDNQRCLIMTICGADAQIMGYNPDRDYRRENYRNLFDKGGLDSYTTEFTLGPSGVFEVRAHGWVTDPDDKILAEEWVSKIVRCFVPVHYGSQVELDAMAGVASGMQSMPELLSPDPVAGHYRLSTEVSGLSGSPGSVFRTAPSPGGSFTLNGAEGKPLRNQGYYSPDGVIAWREGWAGTVGGAGPATLTAGGINNNMSQDGSLEFWVKLADDSANGTDEVLLAINIDENGIWTAGSDPHDACAQALNTYVIPGNIACTIKVERFKNQLRATWYYWGSGRGAVSRYVNGLMEVYHDINWQGGEWQHVTVAWTNTEQDWAAAALGTPITSDMVNDVIEISATGGGGSSGFFPYGACEPGMEWFTLEGETKRNTNYHLGKSGSISTQLDTVFAGGFTHAGSGDAIYTTGAMGGTHYRQLNGTIDDVFLFTSPTLKTRTRGMRYEASGSVTFSLPVPGGYTAAACAVHGVLPSVGGVSASANGGAFPGGGTGTSWTIAMNGPGTATATVEGFSLYLKHRTELLEEGDFLLTGE